MWTKILLQGTASVALFFTCWFGLSQINWEGILKVEKQGSNTEAKLGDLLWELFQKADDEIKTPIVVKSVDSLVTKICTANKIERKSIKIHILEKDEINAFALPNGHLIVYSGLILNAENQEELTGVLSHELAHIQLNHVMKKLIREVGLSVLISMTTGNGGTEILKEVAKKLSSTAFDRNLEKEADLTAVDYMLQAKIDPEPFANFLYKLSDNENEATSLLTWISTHPDSKERAEYIIESLKDRKGSYQEVIQKSTWAHLKSALRVDLN